MIDRGAGFISNAAEPLQGRGRGAKGQPAEIRRGWRRVGLVARETRGPLSQPTVVERYL